MTDDITRDPLALAMFAAWVNCDPAAVPEKFKGHTCPATMAAWKRVGEAALAYFERTPQGMETRQGGDSEAAPSRSDDSPVGEADAPETSGLTFSRGVDGARDNCKAKES